MKPGIQPVREKNITMFSVRDSGMGSQSSVTDKNKFEASGNPDLEANQNQHQVSQEQIQDLDRGAIKNSENVPFEPEDGSDKEEEGFIHQYKLRPDILTEDDLKTERHERKGKVL